MFYQGSFWSGVGPLFFTWILIDFNKKFNVAVAVAVLAATTIFSNMLPTPPPSVSNSSNLYGLFVTNDSNSGRVLLRGKV